MDLFVMIPSCVPATHLETSGAELDADDLKRYRNEPGVLGLAEFMNYPGVLFGDPQATQKLSNFADVVRDGHAPMLRGHDLSAYLCAGIDTCHECTSLDEAREKLRKGMHVLIREGSCAKDANELLPLLNSVSSAVLAFCSDDRNPLDVAAEGHIDHIVDMGLRRGIAPEMIFRAASFGAARTYGLADRGVVAPGYKADLCIVEQHVAGDWKQGCRVDTVIKNGTIVDAGELAGLGDAQVAKARPVSKKANINMPALSLAKLQFPTVSNAAGGGVQCRAIGIVQGKILTEELLVSLPVNYNGAVQAEPNKDLLKIAVVERHHATGNVAVGVVRGFGLREGAIAASIGHDSHNITVVGASDEAMMAAVACVKKSDGGIAVVDGAGNVQGSLSLPIGGLMTDASPDEVAESLLALKTAVRELGCTLEEPFLQLSFLALPVIPDLKLTDKGLVDVRKFAFVEMVCGPQ